MIADSFKTPWMEIQARIKPKNNAPVSPMKILAGLKLYGKNPKPAPATAAVRIATLELLLISVSARSDMEAIDDTPTAKPSRPSIRLTALQIPTIQITETATDTQ